MCSRRQCYTIPYMRINRAWVTRVLFLSFFSGGLVFAQTASIDEVSGGVKVQSPLDGGWSRVQAVPAQLEVGSRVRTGAGDHARITFRDGSEVALKESSDLFIAASGQEKIELELSRGDLLAKVAKLLSRKFLVRTPKAVCSVRGTTFQVSVGADGRTDVRLFEGLLHIADRHGGEALLHPDEMLEIDARVGLVRPLARAPERQEGGRKNTAKAVKKSGETVPSDLRDAVGERDKGGGKTVRPADLQDFRNRGVFADRNDLLREMHSDLRKESRQRLDVQAARSERLQEGVVATDKNGNRLRFENLKLADGQVLVLEQGSRGNSSKTYDMVPPGSSGGSGGSGNSGGVPPRPDNGKGRKK